MAIKYKLGRLPDKVDKRDYSPAKLATIPKLAAAAPKTVKLPAAIDLRAGFGAALNQGNLGSCTAHAGVGLYEYLDRKAFGRVEPRSRLFLYKNSRLLDGFRGDSGSYLRTTMKAMKLFGACPERYWPYTNIAGTYDLMPTAFQYAYGQNSQAITYFRLDPVGAQPSTILNNVKEYLTRGYPVMFGFLVYSSIWRAVQGNVPYPSRGEPCIGGHAIIAVGFNDSKQALLFRNSWGTGWGVQGYGRLPYSYIANRLASDFWTMTSAELLDSGQFS